MQERGFNRTRGLFLIIYQVLLLLSLPIYFYYNSPSGALIATSVILFFLTGVSITAGYHRFYAHRTYKTKPIVESVILFFGAMALQGSALRWSFDHRLHHAHVDTDEDPYSIKKGFWYAHFLWMLETPKEIEPKVVPDLMKNKLVQFQHKYDNALMLGSNFLVLGLLTWIFNDFWGVFFIACWLRIFALHHFTWFINSLAHTWGDKPFCQEQSAVNNYVISLVTFGEGYHNYHHTFANDYRNGIRWYHFDPSKWLIWTLQKVGLAYNLKQMDAYTIKKRMVIERKNLLLEKLCQMWHEKKDELEQKVNETSEQIVAKIARFHELKEQYRELRKQQQAHDLLKQLSEELSELKRSLKADWRSWTQLSRHIYRLEPSTL